MIIRLLMMGIIIFLVLKVYRYVFKEKACDTCGKRIAKEADVCHHCNTIQQKLNS